MEKISGIIPANARTKSVDVSNSQPVRPGAPTWGRPVGRVSQAASMIAPEDRFSVSTDRPADVVSPIYNSRAEISRKKVVEDLAKKFFDTSPKADVRGTELTKSEETLGAMESAQDLAPAIREK